MTGEPARTDPESTSTDAGSDAVTEPGTTPSPTAAQSAPGKASLASIIIDPSLSQPDLPAVTVPASSPPEPPAEPDFDALSADRFAAAYRPSWEGTAIPAEAAPAARAPSHHPSLAPEVSMAVTDDEPLAPLRIAAARRRGMLWVAGSVVGFVVLVYLGIASSTKTEAPAPKPTAIEAEPPTPQAPPQVELPPAQPAPQAAPQPAPVSAAPQPDPAQAPDATVRSDSLQPAAAEPPPLPPPTPAAVAVPATPAPAVAPPAPPAARAATAPKPARKPAAARVAKPAARPAPKPKATAKKGAGFVADSPY